jgi:serum/glucocorticoid-regulated kinase 2
MFTLPGADEGSLYLLSPSVNGGYLLHHLQQARCFEQHTARFYAAELVCALEYLHDLQVFGWLKPRNVLLDSIGHITLCGFGLFRESGNAHGIPEYPAPEVLLAQHRADCRTEDRWTLGVLVYEMLTGLPPFYHEDRHEVRRQILGDQPVPLPGSLPPTSRDFLEKLLDRHPERRLGAHGGAAQIKAHPFFDGVDWHKVYQRRYHPMFNPGPFRLEVELGLEGWKDNWHGFTQYGVTEQPAPRQGFTYNIPTRERRAKAVPASSEALEGPQPPTVEEVSGRMLVWEPVPGEFHIYNHITQTREPIPPRDTTDPHLCGKPNAAAAVDPGIPSQRQKQDLLAAA